MSLVRLSHDYFSGRSQQDVSHLSLLSCFLLFLCAVTSLFLSYNICQLLLLTHTYEPNSDCSLKSNTTFQMHVYIFNSCVVYLCHCLANRLCMRGRRVQRRWMLRTTHCLQQTGCLMHGWLPASFAVVSYSPNTSFLSFTNFCFKLPFYSKRVFVMSIINARTYSAPTLRVTHGCATHHCHHGNVSPTCATKIWPVIQTYSWDACEQKLWQHEAHTDLNRNTTRWTQPDRV